ncbi:MAG: hypothetical protein AB7S26_05060 [Sandaracinaceae bacterium]
MKLGEPIDARVPWIRSIHDFDGARAERSMGVRGDKLRRAAERLSDSLREGPRVVSVRTLPVSDLPYPTRFAFQAAARVPWPYVLMQHRALLIQVEAEGELKNVLFNPTDRESARKTPYFVRFEERYGWAERFMPARFGTVEESLGQLGLAPSDIDVIAWDHFHTVDLRATLGTEHGDGLRDKIAARFENAVLLAPKVEWEDWDHLHPSQRHFFIADGKDDVATSKVVLTENDLWLGDGCLLVRTPGHTSGNQTVFVHGERGVFGCSENGTSCDNWSPYESRIPGLRGFAREYDVEVVLNSNTPEYYAEQYNSMILERSLVDRVPEAPAFVQMFPSSEVTPSPIAPTVRPSHVFGEMTSGTVREGPRNSRSAPARHASA